MKIVIDIDKELFEYIRKNKITIEDVNDIMTIIKIVSNGVPFSYSPAIVDKENK